MTGIFQPVHDGHDLLRRGNDIVLRGLLGWPLDKASGIVRQAATKANG